MNDAINPGYDDDATSTGTNGSAGDDPTDMSVGTFDPSTDSPDSTPNAAGSGAGASAEEDDVTGLDAVVDALPGGGRLDEPEDELSDSASGPVQVP